MNTVQRTLYSNYLQSVLLGNWQFQLEANSTLNELFNIQPGVAPSVTPTLGYYAIGNGGHRITAGANGIPLLAEVQHSGTDAALYNHIPFILREIGNDIDVVTQAQYALRRAETHNGLQYIAYYLKRLPMSTTTPSMEYITVANGVSTTTAFTPTSSNLNPTPPALSNTGVNLVSGDYVAASAKMTIALTPAEITEILNMATIIYGDPNAAIISEIALCSGVDKVVSSVNGAGGNSAQISFNEAIAVQCLTYINSQFFLAGNTQGIQSLLDLGAGESIFNLV